LTAKYAVNDEILQARGAHSVVDCRKRTDPLTQPGFDAGGEEIAPQAAKR
jgi:hypothetical protein